MSDKCFLLAYKKLQHSVRLVQIKKLFFFFLLLSLSTVFSAKYFEFHLNKLFRNRHKSVYE